jgi:BirA family transcriptional regulator, biotin operon repressor / biotin---[acetyl-CoA-carboxylase] ligase
MKQMATPDRIDLTACNQALVGTRFAGKLQHFASVSSTNTLLLEAAATSAPEGTVYIADEQTSGRGRGGHAWHSAPGDGLYVSALVKPSLQLREALLLSLATGIAAWQAVREVTGLQLDLRWPNDLMLQGKKLGGILVETAVEHGDEPWLRHAVIGIGINVHHMSFSAELQPLATSLALQNSTSVDRQHILIAFLRALDRELTGLEQAPQYDTSELLERFAGCSTWVHGKHVHVPEQGGYTGRTAGLDERGFLLVDSDDGIRRTVLSGGVREA